MTIAFWATVALLIAASMFFVLPPLLRPAPAVRAGLSPMAAYRDQRAQIDAELAQGALSQEQHAQALAELQARVVTEVGDVPDEKPVQQTPQSTLFIVAIALAIPAGALAVYGVIGTPSALLPQDQQAAMAADSPHAMSPEQMETLLERLAQKLKANPGDFEGWRMLARSYAAFGRLPEAVQAYEQAYKLQPKNAELLADYADTLAMANGRSLEGKPEQLVKQALQADPKQQKALALMGTIAFNRNDFPAAAAWWKKLLATVEPGSDAAKAIEANIAQAEAGGVPAATRMAAARPAATPAPADNAPAAAASGATIEGSVTLSDKVKASLPAGATLFVYARPTNGSPMPLAIVRAQADSFPTTFRLDDSMAMSPESRISLQQQVQIVARVSKSGNAMPAPGDLTGKTGPVKVGARDVKLVIDEIVK